MCGIAGLFQPRLGGQPPAQSSVAVVASMVAHLQHRGPDDQGVRIVNREGQPTVAFGHTRLAILDLSAAGAQPMASHDGALWITFNGEIYNFRELRARLPEPPGGWRSRSDTEVILVAYAHWGLECLEHFRGMFAFALWDSGRQELLLARDRLGIKPVYYHVAPDGSLVFASEVRALLASGKVERQLDPDGLCQYLAYQCVPAPRTIVRGVSSLLPGSWLRVAADGTLSQDQYWDMLRNGAPPDDVGDPASAVKRTGDLLQQAVTSHLVSDTPVGVFLSGGIDSSVVVGLMRHGGAVPHTFSVALGEKAFDERTYARLVAQRFHADHTEILLSERNLLDQLPDALGAMDHPTGDGINTYVVSGAVRAAGMKVALSGLGGDELFGGYPSFRRIARAAPLGQAWGHLPTTARQAAATAVRTLGRSSVSAAKAAAMLEGSGSVASLYPATRQLFTRRQREELLTASWLEAVTFRGDPYEKLLSTAFAANGQIGTRTSISYAEARTYMHDLLLRDTDQMSMAHGLEARVPLLDHELVEFVVGLPEAYKWRGGSPKPLLVSAVAGMLPDEIIYRPKKGFTLPFEPWMRGPLRDFCERRLASERLAAAGVLRPDTVGRLWQDFLAGRPTVSWSRLWILVALEEWLERNGFAADGSP